MINQSHSQAQIFLNLSLQNRVKLINIEFNIQGCEHAKDNLKRSLYNFSLCLRRLLIVLTMLIATVTNRTSNNRLGETGYKTNKQIKNDTNGNDIVPTNVTFDSIHASLGRQFGYLVLVYSENYDGSQSNLITILRTTLTKNAYRKQRII
jgi:hypothetical protein